MSRHTRSSNNSKTTSSVEQSLINEELRKEVDNLRRAMDRIRQERVVAVVEAPPSYTDSS